MILLWAMKVFFDVTRFELSVMLGDFPVLWSVCVCVGRVRGGERGGERERGGV